MPVVPRLHLFEIDDQPWFPAYLRSKVQAALTFCWVLCVPPFQATSPASLAARTLQRVLGPRVCEYTFVDFCAGAGGPTPYIERSLNARLAAERKGDDNGDGNGAGEHETSEQDDGGVGGGVDFVLTDIAPHLDAWRIAAGRSRHVHYIGRSVDATNAPADLLAELPPLSGDGKTASRPPFRLFNLAFHHFDDPLATAILRNTLQTSNGIAVFELNNRTFLGGLVLTTLLLPLHLLLAPWYFWGDWGMLFFTYLMPVVPFVLVFDGLVSALRVRTPEEMMSLVERARKELRDEDVGEWEWSWGRECHTWPVGHMVWFVGEKKNKNKKKNKKTAGGKEEDVRRR